MPESANVAMAAVTFILIITSIVGNSLVCAVIKKNRDMRYIHRLQDWHSTIITDKLVNGVGKKPGEKKSTTFDLYYFIDLCKENLENNKKRIQTDF